jgi:hypothetical protein
MGVYLIVARGPINLSQMQQMSESIPIVQVDNHRPNNAVASKMRTKEEQTNGRTAETGRQRLDRMRLMLNAGLPCCEPFVEGKHEE